MRHGQFPSHFEIAKASGYWDTPQLNEAELHAGLKAHLSDSFAFNHSITIMPQKGTVKLMPRLRVFLAEEIALGPGKADLLTLIDEIGSIREAAKRMNMSYMRAWRLIQTMNACFREPLVVAERGGNVRGGAQLSKTGAKALALYRQMEQTSLRKNEKNWRSFEPFRGESLG